MPNALSTDHLQTDLRGKSVRSGMVAVASQGSKFFIQTFATLALARLLTPTDFGLVEMAVAITGLGQAFADLGLSEATIQHEKINQNQISALFWINVAIGSALTLVMMACAPLIAWFYGDPRLRSISLVSSLIFLIGGLRVQHDALLKRQMRFVAVAARDVVSYAIAVPLAIVIAWRGGGYWALVVMPLALNGVQMLLSWVMVRWVPSLPRLHSGVGSMVAFGGNVATSYVMSSVNRRVDKVLVGWACGAGPLGLYSKAYNLLMLPVQQLSLPVGSVIVPALSRIHSDRERFARYYLRAANVIIWITAPVFGFLFVAAQPVIMLVLGNQWQGAVPVFQLLLISALAQPLIQISIWSLVSRGQSRQLLRLFLVISPIIIASYVLGLPFGIRGVALVGSAVQLVLLPWILLFTFRGTDLTIRRLAAAVMCPVSLSLGGVCLAELALNLSAPRHLVWQLGVAALSFAISSSLSLFLPAMRKEILSFGTLLRELRLQRQAA